MAPSPSGRLNRIGNAYFGRGRYAEAFSCYQKALEYDRKAADTAELIATLGNLGNICAVSGQREQADTYYREVLSLQKRLGDEGGIGGNGIALAPTIWRREIFWIGCAMTPRWPSFIQTLDWSHVRRGHSTMPFGNTNAPCN